MNFEVRLIDGRAYERLAQTLRERDLESLRKIASTALVNASLGVTSFAWHMPDDETWATDSLRSLASLREALRGSARLDKEELWDLVPQYLDYLVAHFTMWPFQYGRPALFTLDGRTFSNESALDDRTLSLFRAALRRGEVTLPRQPAVGDGKRFMCYLGSRYRGFGQRLDRETGLLEKLEDLDSSQTPRFGDGMCVLDEASAAALLECGGALADEYPLIAEELEALAALRTSDQKYCVSSSSFFEE